MVTMVYSLYMVVLLSVLAIAAKAVTLTTSTTRAAQNNYVVEGRVKVEDMKARAFSRKNSNLKLIWNGGEQVTYVRPDGYFAFPGVSAGTYLLEVSALGYYFSPVRVDVSARLHGQVKAVTVESPKTQRYYVDALVVEPLHEEYYYAKRPPFSTLLFCLPMGSCQPDIQL